MKTIELTNTLSNEEAKREYEKFVTHIKSNNIKCILGILIVFAIAVGLSIGLHGVFSGVGEKIFYVSLSFITILLLATLVSSFEHKCPLCEPATYTYHQICSSYRILDKEIKYNNGEYYTLILTVADKNNEVSYKFIYGFKKIIKTDVVKTTIDLLNRKIYEPYKAEVM